MTSYSDSLRGYAFAIHQRDKFRCRYCGLDGTESFENWLALSEDHLLPKGHPEREKPDFKVTACQFCNTANNKYFDMAAKHGLRFDGMTPDQLVEQRKPFVMKTRQGYRQFWEERVQRRHCAPLLIPSQEIAAPTVPIEWGHGAVHEYLKAWAEFDPSHPPHILGGDETLRRDNTAYTLLKNRSEYDAAKLPKEDHRFHLGLLPQPFHGRPATARVYVLMLNPGFSPDDYAWEYENELFRNALVEQYQGGSPFLFLDPRFKSHPGYGYWYAKSQIAQLIPKIAARLGLTQDEMLGTMAREFAALQLVSYHSSRFDASMSLLDSLRSVRLARRFVAEYALPRARAGECVIIVAPGNWAWNLQPEENVVVYVNPEYRSARLGPATRGGTAIVAHYSGERVPGHAQVVPLPQPPTRPVCMERPLATASPSTWDFGDPQTSVPVLDEMVSSFHMTDDFFRRLHHAENYKNTIQRFRAYCMNDPRGPARFQPGGTNEQTARRLAHCLARLQARDSWETAIADALAQYPE